MLSDRKVLWQWFGGVSGVPAVPCAVSSGGEAIVAVRGRGGGEDPGNVLQFVALCCTGRPGAGVAVRLGNGGRNLRNVLQFVALCYTGGGSRRRRGFPALQRGPKSPKFVAIRCIVLHRRGPEAAGPTGTATGAEIPEMCSNSLHCVAPAFPRGGAPFRHCDRGRKPGEPRSLRDWQPYSDDKVSITVERDFRTSLHLLLFSVAYTVAQTCH